MGFPGHSAHWIPGPFTSLDTPGTATFRRRAERSDAKDVVAQSKSNETLPARVLHDRNEDAEHRGCDRRGADCPTLRKVTPLLPDGSGHPNGFDFNYDYWFGCECGQRNQVPSARYVSLMESSDPDLVCACGEPIDIGDSEPILRDLDDIDCVSADVDKHLWYHSTIHQDWPSFASYDRHIRGEYGGIEEWDPDFRDKVIREKSSVAVHVGTYAAAVENMMRRMTDQPTPGRDYWLHQVQLRLTAGDLSSDVGDEGWSSWGDVPGAELDRLGVFAARYVNLHEAPGSISLAIHPEAITRIVSRVRSIRLPVDAAAAPLVPAGEFATAQALADMKAADALRPDTTGIQADQIFDNPARFLLAKLRGKVSSEAVAVNEQLRRYHARQEEIWASLRRELVAIYLDRVNPWVVHERFERALATKVSTDPESYHRQFRLMAGLLVRPDVVVQQFEKEDWRTP